MKDKKQRDSNTFIEITKINDVSVKKLVPKSNVMSNAGQVALQAHGYTVTDARYSEQLNPTNPIKAAGESKRQMEDNIEMLMQRLNEQDQVIKALQKDDSLEEKPKEEQEDEEMGQTGVDEPQEEQQTTKKAGRPPKK